MATKGSPLSPPAENRRKFLGVLMTLPTLVGCSTSFPEELQSVNDNHQSHPPPSGNDNHPPGGPRFPGAAKRPEIVRMLRAVAVENDINPDTFLRIAWIESKFDPSAHSPYSSAGGLFQFIDSTAKSYGLKDRFDPEQNARAAARLYNDNRRLLRSSLRREPTGGELYLAHQQGAGNAAKLLKVLDSAPQTRAVTLLGRKEVEHNGGHNSTTVAEFVALWTSSFGDLKP